MWYYHKAIILAKLLLISNDFIYHFQDNKFLKININKLQFLSAINFIHFQFMVFFYQFLILIQWFYLHYNFLNKKLPLLPVTLKRMRVIYPTIVWSKIPLPCILAYILNRRDCHTCMSVCGKKTSLSSSWHACKHMSGLLDGWSNEGISKTSKTNWWQLYNITTVITFIIII